MPIGSTSLGDSPTNGAAIPQGRPGPRPRQGRAIAQQHQACIGPRVHWRSASMAAPAFAYFDTEDEAVAYAARAAPGGGNAEVYRTDPVARKSVLVRSVLPDPWR